MARAQARSQRQSQARPRNASRRNGSGNRRKAPLTNARATMQRAVSGDVAAMRAEVDDMISSLEERIDRINALTKRGAGHAADGVNDLVLNAISGLTGQVANRAKNNANSMSNKVARLGTNALRRVVREIDRRPLLTVAIAAGIGFAVAMARRPE
jgi:ElaB/YqjD/DUF883 family membrane-anchored ribosome-binding protein